MAGNEDVGAAGADDPIVACTLGAADLAAQSRRWSELRARAELGQEATASGKRISFRADGEVARELEELAAVERDCCSWASWTVRRADGELQLEVASRGAGVEAIHGMFRPLTLR